MGNFDFRKYNREVFEDTIHIIKSSNEYTQSTNESISKQRLYLENERLPHPKDKYQSECKVIVTKNKTMDAARNYKDKKVAVLNFASATTPGGGVERGASAQEECLCRVSNLYLCLTDKKLWNPFYQKNRDAKDNIHTDDIIYSPNVLVIKNDSYKLAENFNVDVITCAAPNLRDTPENAFNKDLGEAITLTFSEQYKIHYKRAIRIMEVAASNNAEVLILGAFGCGAFRNDPKAVANAYKDAIKLYRKKFETIEFAVYCSNDMTNYNVFKEVFE